MKNYFFKHKGKLALWILGETLYALCMVLWSFFMKSLSDVAFGGALSGINTLLLIGGGYLILFLIVDYCWKRARARFLQACNQELKVDLLKRILCYDFNSFHNGNTAKYISLLNNDVKIADEQFFRIIPSIINNGIMVLTATIAMFVYSPWLAFLCVVMDIIQFLIPTLWGKQSGEAQNHYVTSLEQLNAQIKDIFTGYEVIKSYQIEDKVVTQYADSVKASEVYGFLTRDYQGRSSAVSNFIVYISCVLQMIFSVYLILIGNITMGTLLGAMQISNYVNNPSHTIVELFMQYKTAKPVIKRLDDILNTPVISVKQSETLHKFTSTEAITPITVKDLHYSYQPDREILHGINYSFESGKKYAVMGPSGSGKSTLIRLLQGYYSTYEGELTFAGVPLTEIDFHSLYQKMAVIHQHVFLFETSLRNNITLFQTYPEEDIRTAIRDAGLSELLARHDDNLDFAITEGGQNLSGGEQQRISIARAFLRKSQVLILDEATSNLDASTAKFIEETLLQKKDITLIAITHKTDVSILQQYDDILILEDGNLLSKTS